MKYFQFNNNSVGAVASGYDIDNEMTGNNDADLTVIALSTEVIKQRIERVRKHKGSFKKFIADFANLSDEEKLTMIKAYYGAQFGQLSGALMEEYIAEYPVQTVIKSNLLFVPETTVSVSYKTNVKVLAKKDVRFNGFKTYTKEEIDKLIEEGKIVIIGFEVGKAVRRDCEYVNVENYVERFLPDFEKLSIADLCERFPTIRDRIVADIDVEELKTDYLYQYLPAYKTALKYLAGCARATKELQAQKKRQLRAQIALLDDASAELTEVEKQIADTAKGR